MTAQKLVNLIKKDKIKIKKDNSFTGVNARTVKLPKNKISKVQKLLTSKGFKPYKDSYKQPTVKSWQLNDIKVHINEDGWLQLIGDKKQTKSKYRLPYYD